MRTCLFGGTFDPPHIGHLLVAQTVCEAENFDKVLFIPAYQPPHKDDITPVDERLKMLELAVEGNPNFEISDVELKRKGVSYTIDTVKFIKEEMRLKSQELFYLMGSDSLLEFQNWKDPKGILNECQVIVAIRPGFRPSDIPSWILQKIQFANIPRFEISSSNIRHRWVENKTIRYMVTLPVWEYIEKNNLYAIKS
jgi:nicotinate-nucleotide adenylyltransferase